MSFISEQIQKLRDFANNPEMNDVKELTNTFKEAADTIETLSFKLASANMERSSNYYNIPAWIDVDKAVQVLDRLRDKNPNVEIIVETPNGTSSCKIGDALIYEGMGGEIVFDSE